MMAIILIASVVLATIAWVQITQAETRPRGARRQRW